jgi:hypothetical protein
VLAHEGDGDLRGDAAEGTGVGAYVDEVPCARVGEVCLYLLLSSLFFFVSCSLDYDGVPFQRIATLWIVEGSEPGW